jgi:hypothetical protein
MEEGLHQGGGRLGCLEHVVPAAHTHTGGGGEAGTGAVVFMLVSQAAAAGKVVGCRARPGLPKPRAGVSLLVCLHLQPHKVVLWRA